MDWTLTGESDPTPTEPTLIWRVLRRGARTGSGAFGIPRLTEVKTSSRGQFAEQLSLSSGSPDLAKILASCGKDHA
jgi:hypothetical protein